MSISKPGVSFAIKFGVALTLVIMLITGGSLTYYYQFVRQLVAEQLQGRLLDIARTGSYVLNREDREAIKRVKQNIIANLPADYVSRAARLKTDEIISVLNPDAIDSIHDSADFEGLVQKLRQIQLGTSEFISGLEPLRQSNERNLPTPKISSAYLMAKLPGVSSQTAIFFIADSDYKEVDVDNDSNIVESEQGNSSGNLYHSDSIVFSQPLIDGSYQVSNDWYQDTFGTTMSAVVPIFDENRQVIATLGIDYNVDIHQAKVQSIYIISLSVLLAAIGIGLLFTVLLTLWIKIRLSKLTYAADKLAAQDFTFNVHISGNDEFSLLGASFNRVRDELRSYTEELENRIAERTEHLLTAKQKIEFLKDQLERENAFLGAEVEHVIQLRQRSFPSKELLTPTYSIQCGYLASPLLAGDFIEFISLSADTTVVISGTASGNGLKTALTATLTQQLAGIDAAQLLKQPDEYFYQLNLKLVNAIEQMSLDCMVELSVLIITPTQIISYGKRPIYKLEPSSSSLIQIDANYHPIVLGLNVKLPSNNIQRSTLELNNIDRLLWCSDGIEQFEQPIDVLFPTLSRPDNRVNPDEILTHLKNVTHRDSTGELSLSEDVSYIYWAAHHD